LFQIWSDGQFLASAVASLASVASFSLLSAQVPKCPRAQIKDKKNSAEIFLRLWALKKTEKLFWLQIEIFQVLVVDLQKSRRF
jgi:hypothetical protein